MATIQRGARGTIDLLDDLIVQEMMQKVAVLETNARPITTVLLKLEKALATDTPEPQHSEDELLPNIDVTTAVSTAADLTVDVANPLFYLVGDILHIPRTGENMRVGTAAGTSPITVVRGLGAVPPANLLVGEPIWILGGASREGATSRGALNTLEVQYTEYCQIIRNSIEGTGTQLATRQLGGDFDDQAEKKLIEHKRQLENFVKYGVRSKTTDTGENNRTMGGLIQRIQINRFDVDGVLGEGEWEAFLEQGFQYGNARKLFVAAPRVLRSISNFCRNRLVTVPGDESYGIGLRRYESHSGVVDLVSDRELKGATYGGYGLLLDVDYLVIRYLRAAATAKRPEKYQGNMFCKRIENIQANDADTRKDEWFSECCLQMIHERVHAVMTGVTG